MSGLLDAALIGAGLSVLSGAVVWLAARGLRTRLAGAEVTLWRTARWVTLLPVLLAPLIYLVPAPVETGFGPGLELGPLPDTVRLSTAVAADRPAAIRPDLPLTTLLGGLYLAGLFAMLILCGIRHRARHALLSRTREASREERQPFERLARRIGVRAPALRIGPAGVSPFLTGWQGVVVLPDTDGMTGEARRYSMAHELSHLRRGDERDRLIGAALITLNWFNWPLRRIERELNAAREIACDRDTLKALGGAQRKAYAAALIDMMRSAAPAVSAFGPSNRRHREMRIQAIMTQPVARKGRAIWLAATVLATAVPLAGAQALVTERRPAHAPHAVHLTQTVSPGLPERPASELRAVRAVAPTVPAVPVTAAVPAPAPRVMVDPSAPAAPHTHVHSGQASFGTAVTPPHLTHAVTQGRITSRYGERPARPAGAPAVHHGYDIAAERGTPVAAPGAGVVVHAAAGYRGSEAWGNTIAIDHGNGWQTVYAHLEGFDVAEGDQVAAGEQIGRVGATGRATGPHVHVELHHNGERVDPSGQVPGLD